MRVALLLAALGGCGTASDTAGPDDSSASTTPTGPSTTGACTDLDTDGVCDPNDNCQGVANGSQLDGDGDGDGDACDPCPADPADDADKDGLCAGADNCPVDANPAQDDADGDGRGDLCDLCANDPDDDLDGDGACADLDNCPDVMNADQQDGDGDGAGDPCDACPADPAPDTDGDGVCDGTDTCPSTGDPAQVDADGDGQGDACDACPADAGADPDGDAVCTSADNCPALGNPSQTDVDADGAGDPCDACAGDDATGDGDGDGLCGDVELAYGSDPADADSDDDGRGDGAENADGDGVVDPGETSAIDPDSDGDGTCDGPRLDNDGDGVDPVDACVAPSPGPFVCATGGAAYTDIQSAIDAANDGDVIGVCAGDYDGFDVVGRTLTILGVDGAANTRVARVWGASVVITASVVELGGLTIGGLSTYDTPAAVSVAASDLFAHDVHIADTTTVGSGHAVLQEYSTALWQDCTFARNLQGSTLYVAQYGGSVRFHRTTWRDNAYPLSGNSGGALYRGGGADASFTNSLFAQNTANGSGAFVQLGGTATQRFVNNTVYDHDNWSPTIEVDLGAFVQNNILVYGAGTGLFGPSDGYNLVAYFAQNFTEPPAPTDLQVDPEFAVPGLDFSLAPGSPAIDAGNPDPAYDDADGSRNDLGMYGGPEAFTDVRAPAAW